MTRVSGIAVRPVVRSPTNIWKFTINLPGVMVLAAVTAVVGGDAVWQVARAQAVTRIDARVIAVNIPGASAISQVGTFLNNAAAGMRTSNSHPVPHIHPYRAQCWIRTEFWSAAGRTSAPRSPSASGRRARSCRSTRAGRYPERPAEISHRAAYRPQLSAAPCRCSARTAPTGTTASTTLVRTPLTYTGVSNPLGLSNNNAFGRLWPANAPFGDTGVGSSSILDPTGLPLAGAPNPVIGGVYVGSLTNRNVVAVPQQPQVIPGSLSAGAVGTAFLGPSPDGTCKAVFSVVTADGAIVQEHTLKGLDGLAPAGTVQPLLGRAGILRTRMSSLGSACS